MNHNCTDCHQTIPAGEAVLRSVSFQLVAWHKDCYEIRHLVASVRKQGATA